MIAEMTLKGAQLPVTRGVQAGAMSLQGGGRAQQGAGEG